MLTKQQILLLKLIGEHHWLRERFYLTGGTALSGFYLHHRFSEDLDFFSEEPFDAVQISVFFKEVKGVLGFAEVDIQQSFNRNLFFVRFNDEVLKTEFTYFPFHRIGGGKVEYGVQIDSIIDIAVNKLFTIYQQARARDYLDLYCICQREEYLITNLVDQARGKFDWHVDPLQLGTQFLKATEVKDYPRMIVDLEPDVWQKFFVGEARKLKTGILE
jgi:predicted nucleotidyltransferase component of viral defense system